jgi:hypothetical protein
MTPNNFFLYAPKVILSFFWGIIYAPLWWYSTGLVRLLVKSAGFLRDRQANLGFGIWLKNIFTPMYGQRDFISRLISFLVRLLQVIVRGLGLLIWLVLCFALIFVWLTLPIFAVYALIYQLAL